MLKFSVWFAASSRACRISLLIEGFPSLIRCRRLVRTNCMARFSAVSATISFRIASIALSIIRPPKLCRPCHSRTSYSNATPSGSFSSSGVANTLRWSTSPTSFVRVDCATRIPSAEQSPDGMIAVTQTLTTFAGQQWEGDGGQRHHRGDVMTVKNIVIPLEIEYLQDAAKERGISRTKLVRVVMDELVPKILDDDDLSYAEPPRQRYRRFRDSR